MMRMVQCVKLGKEAEGLGAPPYPGELGQRIFEGVSKEAWQQWLGQPLMSIATLVFVIALLLHTWIGVRDIFMDYVHPLSLRMVMMALLLLSLIGFGLWAGKLLLLTGMS